MYALELSIDTHRWTIFNRRKTDSAFEPIQQKVFRRDHYTCQFCSFQAHEHQEVVNLDGNYRNNKISNLVTACIFCAQCHMLEVVGMSIGGGKLIYLPELAQNELNSLCHVLFCAMTNKTSYFDTAQAIFRNLRFRSKLIEEKYGEGKSDPHAFSELILNSDMIKYQYQLLDGVRLLPSYARFKEQLEDWAQAAMQELAQE